jgi:hypothetical protein
MSEPQMQLETVVEELESKADDYEEVENYEAKKQQYLSALSSVETTLVRLERRVASMEFLAGVLTEVHDRDLPVGGEVDAARKSARSVLDRDVDDLYELAADGRNDAYEQKVQQTMSKIGDADDAVKAELRTVENEWKGRVESARNVQKLVGESREMSRTLTEIEQFVTRKMWNDDEGVPALEFDWNELMETWNSGEGVDWDTFQREHGLSDDTMDVLKDLASEGEIKLDELDEDIATEMLSVDPLRNVVTLSI